MIIEKYKIFIPDTKTDWNVKSTKIANLLAVELANYGLMVDWEILSRLSRFTGEKAQRFAEKILQEYTIGRLNPPLFKNWEDRTSFTLEERVFQIFGYVFQFCGNDFENIQFFNELKEKVDYEGVQRIELATGDEFQAYFESLLGANFALDKKTSNKIVEVLEYFSDNLSSLPRIKSAEIRTAVILALYSNKKSWSNYTLFDLFKALRCNSIDVLRFAAAKRDFQLFKLPADVKYANLSWSERVACSSFLEYKAKNDGMDIYEDMGLNQTAWLRFFKHTHFLGQKGFQNRFPFLTKAVFISSGAKLESITNKTALYEINELSKDGLVEVTDGGNLVYRTFASRIQSAIDEKNWSAIKKCLSEKGRANYLFRNMTTVSNGVPAKNEKDFLKLIRDSIEKIDVGILFSILQIDVCAKYRIIDVKGDTRLEAAAYPSFFNNVQKTIKDYLVEKYGVSGQIVVEPGLENKIVPFLSKNTNTERGTQIFLGDEPYLFFYCHWIEKDTRTDLDLSFISYDKDWEPAIISFREQANQYIQHSGDFTSAPKPNGATEFGRISLNAIPRSTRYIVPVINCFTGNDFKQNTKVTVGFFTSNNNKFTLTRDHYKYNIERESQMNCPLVFDLENTKNGVVTILDYNRKERMGWVAESYSSDIMKLIEVVKTKNYFSIGKFAEMFSGESKKVSITITNSPKNDKEIAPGSLHSIFNS